MPTAEQKALAEVAGTLFDAAMNDWEVNSRYIQHYCVMKLIKYESPASMIPVELRKKAQEFLDQNPEDIISKVKDSLSQLYPILQVLKKIFLCLKITNIEWCIINA